MPSIVFTTHAKERIKERKISSPEVIKAVQNPSSVKKGKQIGTTEFIKIENKKTITVVTSKGVGNELLIISAWIDPPNHGTYDFKKRSDYITYKKANFWGRIIIQLKRIIGF